MKWLKPQIGNRRVKKGFLFFPKAIDGIVIWFEFVAWVEEYQGRYGGGAEWTPVEWGKGE